MSAVVVVQSDDLSAWIGVAGVAVGVVLAAGIDWWRGRRAERKETRNRLLRAGSELASAVAAYQRTWRAAGKAAGEPAWHEAIQARADALHAAALTINLAGNKEIEAASSQLLKVAFQAPPASGLEAITRQLHELAAALAAYREAVRNARL